MIGTNKKDAADTVDCDVRGPRGGHGSPSASRVEPRPIAELLDERGGDHVTYMGWQAIDRAEVAAGEPHGRPRVKFCRVHEMVEAAREAATTQLMADLAELKRMIEEALPGAEVEVLDEGGGDHLRAVVAAPQFEGLSRIDQHRLVRAAVKPRFDDGSIHALSIPRASSGLTAAARYPEAMAADPALKQQVEQAIADNPVLLFMKGVPRRRGAASRCGSSACSSSSGSTTGRSTCCRRCSRCAR